VAEHDQGPHYIPELDPGNRASRANWHNRLALLSLIVLVLAGAAWFFAPLVGLDVWRPQIELAIWISGAIVAIYITAVLIGVS